jgi:hypothetical protein
MFHKYTEGGIKYPGINWCHEPGLGTIINLRTKTISVYFRYRWGHTVPNKLFFNIKYREC